MHTAPPPFETEPFDPTRLLVAVAFDEAVVVFNVALFATDATAEPPSPSEHELRAGNASREYSSLSRSSHAATSVEKKPACARRRKTKTK